MKKLILASIIAASFIAAPITAQAAPGGGGGTSLRVICKLLDRFHDLEPSFCTSEPEPEPSTVAGIPRPRPWIDRTVPIELDPLDINNPIPNAGGFPGYHFPRIPEAEGAYVFEVTLVGVVAAKKLSEEEVCNDDGCATNTTYQVLVKQPSVLTSFHPVVE